jgi:hypothetical protein
MNQKKGKKMEQPELSESKTEEEQVVELQIQKINSLIFSFCLMMEGFVGTDIDTTIELWDYVFYNDLMWQGYGEDHSDVESRKNIWRNSTGQEPYVNSEENIRLLCQLLESKLKLWLDLQDSLVNQKEVSFMDIPIDLPIEMMDEDLEISKEILLAQAELGLFSTIPSAELVPVPVNLFQALPENVRQLILDFVAAKYGPFNLIKLKRVSKEIGDSVKKNPNYALVRACMLISNIASKMPRDTVRPVNMDQRGFFYAQLVSKCNICELGTLTLSLTSDVIQMKKSLFGLLLHTTPGMLKVAGIPLGSEEAEASTQVISGIFHRMEIITVSLASTERTPSNVSKQKYPIDAATKHETIVSMMNAVIQLRKIFTALKIPLSRVADNSLKREQKYVMGMDDVTEVVNVRIGTKMPLLIWHLKEKFPETEFYFNMNMLGPHGYYRMDTIPTLQGHWATSSYKGADILPTDFLRSAAMHSFFRNSLGTLRDSICKVTRIDWKSLITFCGSVDSPWNSTYHSKLEPLDQGYMHMYGTVPADFGPHDNANTDYGLYPSALVRYITIGGKRYYKSPVEIFDQLSGAQFDGSLVTATLACITNIIRTLSRIIPVYWNTGSGLKNQVVFYQDFVGISSIQESESFALQPLSDLFSHYRDQWISILDREKISSPKLKSLVKHYATGSPSATEKAHLKGIFARYKFDNFIDMAKGPSYFQLVVVLLVLYPKSLFRFAGRSLTRERKWAALPPVLTGSKPSKEIYTVHIPSTLFDTMFLVDRKSTRKKDTVISTYTYWSINTIAGWMVNRMRSENRDVDFYSDYAGESITGAYPYMSIIESERIEMSYKNIESFADNALISPLPAYTYAEHIHERFRRKRNYNDQTNNSPGSDNDKSYWQSQIEKGVFAETILVKEKLGMMRAQTINVITQLERYNLPYAAYTEDDLLACQTAEIVKQFKEKQVELMNASLHKQQSEVDRINQIIVKLGPMSPQGLKRPRSVAQL